MSTASEQDHLNPNDRLYYAPRWLRERAETPLSPNAETASDKPGRPVPSPHSFDALLEEAVAESLRHPLDPEVMNEPPGFVRELDRRMAVLSVAGRFAAAIGVSAIVALFFVIMVPASRDYARQPDGANTASVTGMLQSIKAALSQPRQKDEDLKPALSEFQTILASPAAAPAAPPVPAASREESDALLSQFVQWQQKPAPANAP
jgi:hypothetical protein